MQTQAQRILPYLKVEDIFQAVHVSIIYQVNQQESFMVLQDFGDNTFIHLMQCNPEPSSYTSLLLKGV